MNRRDFFKSAFAAIAAVSGHSSPTQAVAKANENAQMSLTYNGVTINCFDVKWRSECMITKWSNLERISIRVFGITEKKADFNLLKNLTVPRKSLSASFPGRTIELDEIDLANGPCPKVYEINPLYGKAGLSLVDFEVSALVPDLDAD